MKTDLTTAERLRYWARALRAETDFYLRGTRYHSAVRLTAGRLMAREIGGEWRDISDALLNGGRPQSSGAREIYMDIPNRVSLELYRNRKRQRENPLAFEIERQDAHTEDERAEFLQAREKANL